MQCTTWIPFQEGPAIQLQGMHLAESLIPGAEVPTSSTCIWALIWVFPNATQTMTKCNTDSRASSFLLCLGCANRAFVLEVPSLLIVPEGPRMSLTKPPPSLFSYWGLSDLDLTSWCFLSLLLSQNSAPNISLGCHRTNFLLLLKQVASSSSQSGGRRIQELEETPGEYSRHQQKVFPPLILHPLWTQPPPLQV